MAGAIIKSFTEIGNTTSGKQNACKYQRLIAEHLLGEAPFTLPPQDKKKGRRNGRHHADNNIRCVVKLFKPIDDRIVNDKKSERGGPA